MKAHIVGGGFGGLAAAGYLIRHAGVPVPTSRSTRPMPRWAAAFFWAATRRAGTTLPERPGASFALPRRRRGHRPD